VADQQIGNQPGVCACHTGSGTQRSNMTGSNTSPQDGWDDTGVNDDAIATMRARLTAINGTYYTAARLNTLTYNDMLYAIRLNDFASTVR
jgi:hypothetical protein